ncbi:MAG: hypothetical protein K2Q06_07920 [Parvularculaceae bacterium]|nr:hypothetical protein [Parvularculaceae bacterium]
MSLTLAAARFSRSPYIWAAAVVLAFNWAGSVALWVIDRGIVQWGYIVVDAATLLYFFRRWSEPNARHRAFHLILMSTHVVTVGFAAFQILFKDLLPGAVSLSARWYQFLDNVLFVAELGGVSAYALLSRRAKADPVKWKAETDAWLQRREKHKRDEEKKSASSVDDV